MTDIHSCSYYCDRPACIKAQRDELRDKLAAQRTWVGLTPKEVAEIVIYPMNKTADLVRIIEAKLRENNDR